METLLILTFVLLLYYSFFKILSITNNKTFTKNEGENVEEIIESAWDEIE